MPDLVYRTDGPWGAGKGANLTPEEVDVNFAALNDALENFLAAIPTPVGIADFTVDDTTGTFTVTLTDASVFGPMPLPRIIMKWQGEWEGGRLYEVNDLVNVQGLGVYLVLEPHESASDFDPDEQNTDGFLYVLVFGMPTSTAIPLSVSTVDGIEDLAASHLGTYRRFTSDGFNMYRILSDDSYDPPLPDGATVTIRQVGAGTLEWLEGPDVIIIAPDTLRLRKQGSTSTAVKVDVNTWEVSGDLLTELVSA